MEETDSAPSRRRPPWGPIAAWTTVVVTLLGLLAVVTALALSVIVDGSSMRPTLADKDRLLIDPFGAEVERFDIVEALRGSKQQAIVKRVIGMPGDRIRVDFDAAGEAVVLVQPAGSERTFRVDSPTWPGRVGARNRPCCDAAGKALNPGRPGQWVTVPAASYWLIGDNWGGSDDSRLFGFFRADAIASRVLGRIQPLGRLGGVGNRPRLVAVADPPA